MYPGLGAKATWPRCFLKRFRESVTDAPGRTGEEEEGRVLDEPLTWSFLHRHTLLFTGTSFFPVGFSLDRAAPRAAGSSPVGTEAAPLGGRGRSLKPPRRQGPPCTGHRHAWRQVPSETLLPLSLLPPADPRLRSRTRKTPALVKSQGPWHVRAPPAGSPAA